jgi:hypothetical protein
MRIDHIQMAIPEGTEDRCRPFWLALGFVELEKPEGLAGRGGIWFCKGQVELHLGVDPAFSAATKAHPGFAVSCLDALVKTISAVGAPVIWDESIAGRRRFFTTDPVGNRIEFLED